jgi:acylglycerol lipase
MLVLHGNDDRVTDPQGSSQLVANAASADKTMRLYEGMLHDLMHEPVADQATREIVAFVSARLTASR